MNDTTKHALRYVKYADGNATKKHFIEDHDPIGEVLWSALTGLVWLDENDKILLTEAGKQELINL